jgi:predicted nuclease of predicted toxin-antitoxin system
MKFLVDFLNSHLIKSCPRKLIIVKTGNTSNKPLIEIFSKNLDIIIEMIQRADLVEINQNFIAERKR